MKHSLPKTKYVAIWFLFIAVSVFANAQTPLLEACVRLFRSIAMNQRTSDDGRFADVLHPPWLILAESDPGHLRWARSLRREQRSRRTLFRKSQKSVPSWVGFPNRRLPGNLKRELSRRYGKDAKDLHRAFKELLWLGSHGDDYFRRLQGLEGRVLLRMRGDAIPDSAEARLRTLEVLLAENERALGFSAAVDVAEVQNLEAFQARLAAGVPFYDKVFQDDEARQADPHGGLTHRIQLYIWSQAVIEKVSARQTDSGDSIPLLVYKVMGDAELMASLKWDGAGFRADVPRQHLWHALLDQINVSSKDFCSPETLRKQHEYLPGLGPWK